MKVLHVAYIGMDGKLNGVSEAVMKLARAQKEHGPEVKICITTRHSIIDEEFIHYTPSMDDFKTIVESFKPDIVSFHSLYEFQQMNIFLLFEKPKYSVCSCISWRSMHIKTIMLLSISNV